MSDESKCPVMGGGAQRPAAGRGTSNRDWWPNQLNLNILHQNSPLGNPMGEAFNYAEEFKKLDLEALKQQVKGGDVDARLTTTQLAIAVHPARLDISHSQP